VNCVGGPFSNNCNLSLNDQTLSNAEIVAIANSKYGFDKSTTDKILGSLASVQDGDLKTAANTLGINSTIEKEIESGTISDSSA
ncbi:hypothetical protein, partial [Pseudomonas aeruginosa]|uniref:hypothetical protein n=1 Tax=Pseudomonas aeruginosa TaxID=287 RepID=UPI002B414E86